MSNIPLLTAEDIECRVQILKSTPPFGCSLLLYKDARVDMRILDEIYGPTGWQRTHEVINENLFCTVEIWDDDKKQWIKKQDVGVESKTEAEKGQASDAFKRAGFNVGIGRELYTAPFIWVVLDEIELDSNKRLKTKFYVKEIGYNERREINRLIIVDQKKGERFSLGVSEEEKKKKHENLAQKRIEDHLIPMTQEVIHDTKLLSKLYRIEIEESEKGNKFNLKNFMSQYYKFDDSSFETFIKVYDKYKISAA